MPGNNLKSGNLFCLSCGNPDLVPTWILESPSTVLVNGPSISHYQISALFLLWVCSPPCVVQFSLDFFHVLPACPRNQLCFFAIRGEQCPVVLLALLLMTDRSHAMYTMSTKLLTTNALHELTFSETVGLGSFWCLNCSASLLSRLRLTHWTHNSHSISSLHWQLANAVLTAGKRSFQSGEGRIYRSTEVPDWHF